MGFPLPDVELPSPVEVSLQVGSFNPASPPGPELAFFVAGRPGPKGSTNRSAQYTDPTATIARPWQIVVVFRFRRPKRPKYLWPAHADIDKLGRATVDGLVDAGLLSDDRHVTGLYLRKEFAEPGEPEGALIEVWR